MLCFGRVGCPLVEMLVLEAGCACTLLTWQSIAAMQREWGHPLPEDSRALGALPLKSSACWRSYLSP